jgi:hypothetical protein
MTARGVAARGEVGVVLIYATNVRRRKTVIKESCMLLLDVD